MAKFKVYIESDFCKYEILKRIGFLEELIKIGAKGTIISAKGDDYHIVIHTHPNGNPIDAKIVGRNNYWIPKAHVKVEIKEGDTVVITGNEDNETFYSVGAKGVVYKRVSDNSCEVDFSKFEQEEGVYAKPTANFGWWVDNNDMKLLTD